EMDDWLQVRTRPVRGFMMRDFIVEIIGGGIGDAEAYSAAVNEKNVNLRSGPGENFAVLGILPRDTQLRVFRSTGVWAEVETLVHQGYLRKEFIKRSNGETIPTSDENATPVATVATDGLALRSGPSEDATILGLLSSGLQLRVLDMTGSWLRVRPLIDTAYVASQYITDSSVAAPAPTPILADTLQPPPHEIIPIESYFSTEQRIMAETWNQYGGLIKKISVEFSIQSVVALGVLCVESGGKGFGPDGRMIIRFENHYFYNYWGINNPELYAFHFRFNADKPWQGHEYRPTTAAAWQPVHTGQQESEWQVFEFASRLNRNAALMSISMGSPQIMGANYAILCYSAVEEMFFAFQNDIRNQIRGLFRYIQGKNLTPSLVAEDFVAFARVYNGPANATIYGNKLKKHVDEFRKIFEFS
ncbi:MAG: N-acetylmuramidase domain-containing protein, partial [candidate division KSB1 bacterium]|nr:N-acetylmuramidase domain-containing protein [candidate division KSB1 bacterium]